MSPKISNYLLTLNNLKKKKKMTETENGLFFKTGLSVLLLVEEEKCSFKEFANPPLELVLLVKKDQKFLKKTVIKTHVPISAKEDLVDLPLKLELQLSEPKKFLTDLKDMNFVNSKKKMLKSCSISQELPCLSLTLLELS